MSSTAQCAQSRPRHSRRPSTVGQTMDAFENRHGHLKVNSMSNRKPMKVALYWCYVVVLPGATCFSLQYYSDTLTAKSVAGTLVQTYRNLQPKYMKRGREWSLEHRRLDESIVCHLDEDLGHYRPPTSQSLWLEMGKNPEVWIRVRFWLFDDKGSVLFGFWVLLKYRFGSSSVNVGFGFGSIEFFVDGIGNMTVSLVDICYGLTIIVSTR